MGGFFPLPVTNVLSPIEEDMRRRSTVVLISTLALSCIALSSCTFSDPAAGNNPQTSGLPPDLAGLQFSDPQSAHLYAEYDKALPIDPCALHDPTLAAQVTGQQGDQLQPGDGINSCVLRTGDDNASWNLYIKVGENFDQVNEQSDAPVQIAGTTYYRANTGEGTCSYFYAPILDKDSAMSVELDVQIGAGDSNPQLVSQACDIGQRYLQGLSKVWFSSPGQFAPQTRDVSAAQPHLTLGLKRSPCDTMAYAKNTLSQTPGTDPGLTVVNRTDPSNCSLEDNFRPDPVTGQQQTPVTRAQVDFLVDSDPAGGAKNDSTLQSIQVAGHPGWIQPPTPATGSEACRIEVRYDNTLIDMDMSEPGKQVIAPIVEITTPDCNDTQRYAQYVVPETTS